MIFRDVGFITVGESEKMCQKFESHEHPEDEKEEKRLDYIRGKWFRIHGFSTLLWFNFWACLTVNIAYNFAAGMSLFWLMHSKLRIFSVSFSLLNLV